ncbi:immunity 49 family protein [Gloeobacter violaceus]|nr:immunity 49 family protein [Gloeobacter violaceus]
MNKQTIKAKQLVDTIYEGLTVSHNSSSLRMLSSLVQGYAGYLSVSFPESVEICESIQLAAKSAAALFALASTSESELEIYLSKDTSIRLPAKVDHSGVNCSAWCSGYYLAVICRDLPVLDNLCRIPLELLRRSSTRYDEFTYSYISALQSYWQGKDDAADHLIAAMTNAKPDKLHFCSEEYLYLKAISQMELLFNLMRKDEEAFNKSLYIALECHHELCDLDDETRLDSRLFLAYDLLALASLAHEQGMTVRVESDYLPLSIVQGKCAV